MTLLQAAPSSSTDLSDYSGTIFIALAIAIVIYFMIRKKTSKSGLGKPEYSDTLNENKYPALRFISGFYRAMAYLVAIFSIVVPVIIFIKGLQYNDTSNFVAGFTTATAIYLFGGGLIAATLLFAISEGIMVFIDIEYNTRKSGYIKQAHHETNNNSNVNINKAADSLENETNVNPDFFEKGDDEEMNDPTGLYTPTKNDVFVEENDIYEFLENHKFKSRLGYIVNCENRMFTILSPKGRKLQFVNLDVMNGYKDNSAKIEGKYAENNKPYIFVVNSEKGTIIDYNETIYYAIS